MSKREERLLSESGRMLSTPANVQRPANSGSGECEWELGDLDFRDGQGERQGSIPGQQRQACRPVCDSEATQDGDAPIIAACRDGVHLLAKASAGNGAAPLLGGPGNQTTPEEKAVTLSGRGRDDSKYSQQAQHGSTVAVALPGRSEGLGMESRIRTCPEQTEPRETEVQCQAATSGSRSGVQAELQRLQEMFSCGAPSRYVAPGEEMPLTQEQADLALAAKLQDEEVRLHRKRVLAATKVPPFKAKTAKLNTLDAFVKRTA